MKLCINGSRECEDYKFLKQAVETYKINLEEVTEIVSGKCRGADELGEILAKEHKIKVKEFPAKWDDLTVKGASVKNNKFGKPYNSKAGFQRNREMAEYADQLLCLQPNGTDTSGSQDCVEQFQKLGKPVNIYYGPEGKAKKRYQF